VSLWLPEAGGPIDLNNPAHQALVTMLVVRDSGVFTGRCCRRVS
jgi:hypothetical protein